MGELTKLPNIAAKLEAQLAEVGITTVAENGLDLYGNEATITHFDGGSHMISSNYTDFPRFLLSFTTARGKPFAFAIDQKQYAFRK